MRRSPNTDSLGIPTFRRGAAATSVIEARPAYRMRSSASMRYSGDADRALVHALARRRRRTFAGARRRDDAKADAEADPEAGARHARGRRRGAARAPRRVAQGGEPRRLRAGLVRRRRRRRADPRAHLLRRLGRHGAQPAALGRRRRRSDRRAGRSRSGRSGGRTRPACAPATASKDSPWAPIGWRT